MNSQQKCRHAHIDTKLMKKKTCSDTIKDYCVTNSSVCRYIIKSTTNRINEQLATIHNKYNILFLSVILLMRFSFYTLLILLL